MSKKQILICGCQAFAAEGLAEQLNSEGWAVDGYARRSSNPSISLRHSISGEASKVDSQPGLADEYDVVVNFLLLKDDDIEHNKKYLDSLIRLCTSKRVKHLIHISSVSVYPGRTRSIDEQTLIESEPSSKGRYGALKVATDQHLNAKFPSTIHLSFVRPGFILGKGLVDPIVGMAFRTPFNRLLVLGDRKNVVPITTREILHKAISTLASNGPCPETDRSPYLLVSPESPTRSDFLKYLCHGSGFGKGVLWAPTWLWKTAAYTAGIAESLLRLKLNIKKTLLNATRHQQFESSVTSRRLNIDLNVKWKDALVRSLDGQLRNYEVPEAMPSSPISLNSIGIIGWGRIVKQKHLPALEVLKCKPTICAYDLKEADSPEGVRIKSIDGGRLDDAQLYVVATPGPVHTQAIPLLKQVTSPIIVEKPLAYNPNELDLWLDFASKSPASISVCHNYRFKSNVDKMWEYIRLFNPGRIRHVDVWFQSPPVANESAVWLKDERKAKTLLYDYGIHFLDVACMLSRTAWKVDSVRADCNSRQETSLIQGQASCATYTVSFLLRQGAIPRRASVRYVFQNYDVTLDFFPETFSINMGSRSPYLMRRAARSLSSALFKKGLERITKRDTDTSHAAIYRQALGSNKLNTVTVESLESFYRLLYDIGERVYE